MTFNTQDNDRTLHNMATTYEQITARAEAIKRRKQEEYQPLFGKVYRQNEKRTSQYSKSNQTSSSHDEVGSVEGGVSTLATEHDALKAAGGVPFVYNTDPQPLIDKPERPYTGVPNKYIGRKYCVACEAWKLKEEFTPRRDVVDGCHSYCRDCRNSKRRKGNVYQPPKNWKRAK